MFFTKFILTYSATFTFTTVVINIHGQPLRHRGKLECDHDISEHEERNQFPLALYKPQKFLGQTRTNSQNENEISVLKNTNIENGDAKNVLQRCIRSYGKKTRNKRKQKARMHVNSRKKNEKKKEQKKRARMMKKKQKTSALKNGKCKKRTQINNNERHFSSKVTHTPGRAGNKRKRKISTRRSHIIKPMAVDKTTATITAIHAINHATKFETVARNKPNLATRIISKTHRDYIEENSAFEEITTTQANSIEYTSDDFYQSAEQPERQNSPEQFTSEAESSIETTATTSVYYGCPILKFLCDPSMRPFMRIPVHLISLIGRFQRIKNDKKFVGDDNKDQDTTTERLAQSDKQFIDEPANNAAESESPEVNTRLKITTDSPSLNFDLYYNKYLDSPLSRHNYCLPP